LNVGVDTGSGNWVLPPKRLSEIALTLPQSAGNLVALEAQAIDITGKAPVSAKKKFTIHINEASASKDWSTSKVETQEIRVPQSSSGLPIQSAALGIFNTQTVPTTSPGKDTNLAAAVTKSDEKVKTQTAGFQTGIQVTTPAQSEKLATSVSQPQPQDTPTQGKTIVVSRPEIEDLIREGNKRMREGDIVQARAFYQQAYSLGDAEAALAMGRSFDPIYFERIPKKNAEPDPAQAFEWYKLAMDGGVTQTAKIRIDNLKQYLSR
jgi:hypothetical protein